MHTSAYLSNPSLGDSMPQPEEDDDNTNDSNVNANSSSSTGTAGARAASSNLAATASTTKRNSTVASSTTTSGYSSDEEAHQWFSSYFSCFDSASSSSISSIPISALFPSDSALQTLAKSLSLSSSSESTSMSLAAQSPALKKLIRTSFPSSLRVSLYSQIAHCFTFFSGTGQSLVDLQRSYSMALCEVFDAADTGAANANEEGDAIAHHNLPMFGCRHWRGDWLAQSFIVGLPGPAETVDAQIKAMAAAAAQQQAAGKAGTKSASVSSALPSSLSSGRSSSSTSSQKANSGSSISTRRAFPACYLVATERLLCALAVRCSTYINYAPFLPSLILLFLSTGLDEPTIFAIIFCLFSSYSNLKRLEYFLPFSPSSHRLFLSTLEAFISRREGKWLTNAKDRFQLPATKFRRILLEPTLDSFFLNCLPLHVAVRVLDCWLVEGEKIIVRTLSAMVGLQKKRISTVIEEAERDGVEEVAKRLHQMVNTKEKDKEKSKDKERTSQTSIAPVSSASTSSATAAVRPHRALSSYLLSLFSSITCESLLSSAFSMSFSRKDFSSLESIVRSSAALYAALPPSAPLFHLPQLQPPLHKDSGRALKSSEILLRRDLALYLWHYLPPELQLCDARCVFSTAVHGYYYRNFLERVSAQKNESSVNGVLVLLQTGNAEPYDVCGFFLPVCWSYPIDHSSMPMHLDGRAVLFTLKPEKQVYRHENYRAFLQEAELRRQESDVGRPKRPKGGADDDDDRSDDDETEEKKSSPVLLRAASPSSSTDCFVLISDDYFVLGDYHSVLLHFDRSLRHLSSSSSAVFSSLPLLSASQSMQTTKVKMGRTMKEEEEERKLEEEVNRRWKVAAQAGKTEDNKNTEEQREKEIEKEKEKKDKEHSNDGYERRTAKIISVEVWAFQMPTH